MSTAVPDPKASREAMNTEVPWDEEEEEEDLLAAVEDPEVGSVVADSVEEDLRWDVVEWAGDHRASSKVGSTDQRWDAVAVVPQVVVSMDLQVPAGQAKTSEEITPVAISVLGVVVEDPAQAATDPQAEKMTRADLTDLHLAAADHQAVPATKSSEAHPKVKTETTALPGAVTISRTLTGRREGAISAPEATITDRPAAGTTTSSVRPGEDAAALEVAGS